MVFPPFIILTPQLESSSITFNCRRFPDRISSTAMERDDRPMPMGAIHTNCRRVIPGVQARDDTSAQNAWSHVSYPPCAVNLLYSLRVDEDRYDVLRKAGWRDARSGKTDICGTGMLQKQIIPFRITMCWQRQARCAGKDRGVVIRVVDIRLFRGEENLTGGVPRLF